MNDAPWIGMCRDDWYEVEPYTDDEDEEDEEGEDDEFVQSDE